jgi:hypothetical protein
MPGPISGAILGTSTYLHQCVLPRTSRLDHRPETPLHRTEGAVRCPAWIPNRMRARSWERRSEISTLTWFTRWQDWGILENGQIREPRNAHDRPRQEILVIWWVRQDVRPGPRVCKPCNIVNDVTFIFLNCSWANHSRRRPGRLMGLGSERQKLRREH